MVDAFSPAFTLAPLAPLAQAPAPIASGGGSGVGVGLGHRIDVDWSATRRDVDAATRAKRRAAVTKARATVEGRDPRPQHESKAQRLARQANAGKRDTGGLQERRAILGSVAKAVAALEGVPSDSAISDPEFRKLREILRQRYPGAKLSEMLAEGQRMEAMLLDDPVQARLHLVAAYSRAAPVWGYVDPQHVSGTRDALQRARQDAEDAEDLKDWIAKFGKRLPAIFAELEFTDRELRRDAALTSAKLAVRHGAPATEAEIEPYRAKHAAKAQLNNILNGVQAAISHGLISGDEKDLNLMGDVLAHPKFPWEQHRRDHGVHANAHALIHAHEVVQKMRAQDRAGKVTPGGRDPGSLSIGGGTPGNRHWAPGQRSAREAINRAAGS